MSAVSAALRSEISLCGEWSFVLDPEDVGERAGWFDTRPSATIQVPGSWEEQGYGSAPASYLMSGWSKLREYEGTAWYSRQIHIPAEWHGKAITLTLKGVRWLSRVWVDGVYAGEQDSLSVAHQFDLTRLVTPGSTHHLAVRVDNRMLYPLQESHINSLQTATHWGGITGDAELSAVSQTALQTVRCFPNVAARCFDFEVTVSGAVAKCHVEVAVTNPETGVTLTAQKEIAAGKAQLTVELGAAARLWWDDDPFLYTARFSLSADGSPSDVVERRLGLREISALGNQLLLNGVPVFLRGYVDCCIFPQTGYPTWDVEHYRRQFRIAQNYGFNHVRLHSWTAPEPFWEAADECGMLVQTELPNWTPHYGYAHSQPPEAIHQYLKRELHAIIAALQTHPSWVLFSNGNELIYESDGHPRLLELSEEGKALDPSRLYTDQTGMGQLPAPSRAVDYYIQSCNWHPPKKIYDAASANTLEDFSAVTAFADRPMIGHEHGQFTMYVRPVEAEKYLGVVQPSWLESVNATFAAKGMTERVEDYIHASGTHIVRTYKENLERARRTPGLAGIQLLDIRDFPGQGHATTGILDMFWDSKGVVEPDAFRTSNDAAVLLMRAAAPTFWNGGRLSVEIEISNYRRTAITDELRWWLRDRATGTEISGQLSAVTAPLGVLTKLGQINIDLPANTTACAWELRVELGAATNAWHVWSFPYPLARRIPDTTIISRVAALKNLLPHIEYSDDFTGTGLDMYNSYRLSLSHRLAISDRLTMRLLQYVHDGGSLWLMPQRESLFDSVPTRYLPPFWSYLHFPDNVSSVMGMLIHSHPALGRFPHDGVSDWHWYGLVNETPAICLESVPAVEPIVEVVDNFNRAKRLAYAFEVRIGRGRLFVSTFRLTDAATAGRPEGSFLLNEILTYLSSDAFAPATVLSVGQVLGLIRLTNGQTFGLE